MSATGLSDVAIGCWHTEVQPAETGDGDDDGVRGHGGQRRQLPHRTGLPRRDQAYGFAQDYNGIAPVEPVQVEEWQIGAPPGAYDGPYWRAEWWARMPVSKRRGGVRHTDEGERFDDFAIRQEWWTGDALPDGQGGAPGTGRGAQGRGGRACPRRRWRNCSGTRSPRSEPTWPGSRGNNFRYFVRRMERNGHGDSTLPP